MEGAGCVCFRRPLAAPPLPLGCAVQVPDLRLALKAVGLHAEGNRYEMMERLIAYRQSRRTSTIVEDSDNADELLQRVSGPGAGGGGEGRGDTRGMHLLIQRLLRTRTLQMSCCSE